MYRNLHCISISQHHSITKWIWKFLKKIFVHTFIASYDVKFNSIKSVNFDRLIDCQQAALASILASHVCSNSLLDGSLFCILLFRSCRCNYENEKNFAISISFLCFQSIFPIEYWIKGMRRDCEYHIVSMRESRTLEIQLYIERYDKFSRVCSIISVGG